MATFVPLLSKRHQFGETSKEFGAVIMTMLKISIIIMTMIMLKNINNINDGYFVKMYFFILFSPPWDQATGCSLVPCVHFNE